MLLENASEQKSGHYSYVVRAQAIVFMVLYVVCCCTASKHPSHIEKCNDRLSKDNFNIKGANHSRGCDGSTRIGTEWSTQVSISLRFLAIFTCFLHICNDIAFK